MTWSGAGKFDSWSHTLLEKFLYNIILILVFTGINTLIIFLGNKGIGGKLFKNQFKLPPGEKLNFFNALYFTTITHFTVGYGDYFPVGKIARITTALHVFLAWLINLVPMKTLLAQLQYKLDNKNIRQSKDKALASLGYTKSSEFFKKKFFNGSKKTPKISPLLKPPTSSKYKSNIMGSISE